MRREIMKELVEEGELHIGVGEVLSLSIKKGKEKKKVNTDRWIHEVMIGRV